MRPFVVLLYAAGFLAANEKVQGITLRAELRGTLQVADPDPDAEKWAEMAAWADNLGEPGSDFVDAMKEFDKTLEEKAAKAADDKATAAAKKKYDNQIASWSKVKKEWSESNKVKVDAIKAATTGIKSVVAAIKKDDTVGAVSAAFEAMGSIALVLPGGQGFGLAFSVIGAVIGFFSPAAKSAKPLTLEDIRKVVTDVVKKEFQNFASDQSKLNLLTKCNQIGSNVDSVYIDIGYYSAVELSSEEKRRTVAKAIINGIDNIKSTIKSIAELYSDIDTSIETNNIVQTDPAKAPCYDACALMTVMFDHWSANPGNIDYVNPKPSMQDNDSSFWSSSFSYWYPCPRKGSIPSEKYGNAAYKNCISHSTWKSYEDGCATGCDMASCVMDKGCEKRVDNINGCRDALHTSQGYFASLGEVLMCAHKQSLAMDALVKNLESLGAVYNNFQGFLKEDYAVKLGDLNAQMQRLMFYVQYRSLKITKAFTMNGNAYTCDDPNRAWTKEFNIGKFGNGQEYLINGPCSTDSWLNRGSPIDSAFFEDRFKCNKIQDSSKPTPKWDQMSPYYNYAQLTKVKWQTEFKLPTV